jgi:hypothetical protein
LAQLIPTHITRPHFQSIDGYLRWLLECHKSQQLPLSLQQAHWAELLELEYPPEEELDQLASSETSLEEEDDLAEDRLMAQDRQEVEDLLMAETPQTRPETPTLEEGEIPQTPGGGGNPPDGRLSDKLIGREPEIYDGERAKVENFLTEWNVYRALNDQTRVMATPLERTMLFLTFIRGPKVGNWVNDQVKTVGKYIRQGGHKTDEFIWDTVIDEFANTFQDIMSHERAENELNHLRMEGGNLDIYSAEFKRLARLAEYNLEERLVGRKYFDGLPEGLRRAIVKDENMSLLISVADYEDAAIRYHRKFLQVQAFFDKSGKSKKPTRQQWQQRFVKDPNAMDLTPGRTRVRAALTDDEMNKLRQEGKCFKCKRQGHIGRNCPNQNSQIRATNSGGPQTHPATNTSTASSGAITSPISIRKAITAQELVDLVRDMDQGEKDKVIQDIFMQEDFAAALT